MATDTEALLDDTDRALVAALSLRRLYNGKAV
jgi:hypothetical protein